MADIEPIEYTLEVLSPLFTAGADNARFELRGASLKSLLRYWWRVLNPGKGLDDENEIWGGTKKAFPFRLTVAYRGTVRPRGTFMGSMSRDRVNRVYMMGMGLLKYDRRRRGFVTTREYLSPGGRVHVSILPLGPGDTEALTQEIELAVKAFVLFGGWGSRARKGLGALEMVEPEGPGSLRDDPELLKTFKGAGLSIWEGEPRFDRWEDALDYLAKGYRGFRLGGARTTTDYRELVIPMYKREVAGGVSKLAPMGLPIQFQSRNSLPKVVGQVYRKQVDHVTVSMAPTAEGDKDGRRPSPFWITLYREGDKLGIRLTLLPKAMLGFPDNVYLKHNKATSQRRVVGLPHIPRVKVRVSQVEKTVEKLAEHLKLTRL